MKKGFTLVELIVVIIIVGILASVGMGQYAKMVEKSRWAEARTILGSIRTLGIAYQVENSAYAANLATLDNDIPGACAATHFFSYSYAATGTATATRCGATGKSPGGTTDSVGKTKTLTAAGDWGGTGTGY